MTRKRGLMAILAIAVVGWVVFVSLSLLHVGDSFEELTSRESQNAERVIETESQPSTEDVIEGTVTSESVATENENPTENEALPGAPPEVQTSNSTWRPVSNELRCLYAASTGFVAVRMDSAEGSLPFGYHMSLSDSALRVRADSGEDGLAQYVYAHRLLDIGTVPGNVILPSEYVVATFDSTADEKFQLVTEYLIAAVRNSNWGATKRLAAIYFPFDKVEARAWLLIDAMAGGTVLEIGPISPYFKRTIVDQLNALSEEEKAASAARANDLVAEFELSEGLLSLNEC